MRRRALTLSLWLCLSLSLSAVAAANYATKHAATLLLTLPKPFCFPSSLVQIWIVIKHTSFGLGQLIYYR